MAEIPNRTLSRGLRMLELLGKHPQGLALYELAQQLDLPRSTAFNLARTLTELEYICFDPKTNLYTLGLRLFEVGSAAVEKIDMLSLIRGCMMEIYHQINETVHLGVRTDLDVLYIDKIESTQMVRMTSHVGGRQPLYATALGKAILAGMRDEQVRLLYRHASFIPMTEHTTASFDELMRQLAEIRQRGYAIEQNESVQGISCAAVALRDQLGQPMYAISVSAPSYRASLDDLMAYGALLLAAKEKIEHFTRVSGFTAR